jgi:hypothetical protein
MKARKVEELAQKLLDVLLERYTLSYREILRIIPEKYFEEVVLHLVNAYRHKYDIRCETTATPSIMFYGAKAPGEILRSLDEDDTVTPCMLMVKKVLKILEEERQRARCRDKIVRIGTKQYVKLSDKLVADHLYFYLVDGGKLKKNMKWTIVWKKYLAGYKNRFVEWAGKKIEELLPCIDFLVNHELDETV